MRIACVSWSYDDHQGISRSVRGLTARLAAEHEVHVYAAHVAAEPCPGVRVHHVPLRYDGPHAGDWDFFFRAGRLLRRERFDLLHLHFPAWCPADVYTCHGLARMALRSWRRFPPHARVDVPLLRMIPWHAQIPLYSYVARRGAGVISAVSRKTQQELAEESGRPAGQIPIVPNAIDLQRFRPEEAARLRAESRARLQLGAEQFVLLWVGNHLRHKGFRYALRTLERLGADAVLVAVGDDSPATLPDLTAALRALEGAGRLRFMPADPKIEQCYAAADALLFPSLYESFGLVVLEAMAMGLPVITARTVGFAEETIVDGVNGFVVDRPWDVDALAERARHLMAQPDLRHRVGAAAARSALRFGWDEHMRLTEGLYEKALAMRAHRRRAAHAV